MRNAKKTPKHLKAFKQLTLESLPSAPTKEPAKTTEHVQEKRIFINEIGTLTKEDELVLKIGFKLLPSKTAFSKVKSDLWFDNQHLSSTLIRIPQGLLARDEFELTPVLDMKGIAAGSHVIRVEMYESWSNGEKLSPAQKEVTVEYVLKTRGSRLIRIPTVKSFGSTDLAVVSESDKNIYREIQETTKRESITRRDQW